MKPKRSKIKRKQVALRLTGRQHQLLRAHLFPGDGCEAIALALYGRHQSADREILLVHRIELVPHDECFERTPQRVHWPTTRVEALVEEAARRGQGLLKIHSHPTGYAEFSLCDDRSDGELFPSLHGWTDDGRPHASAVMLPDGQIFGRAHWDDGTTQPLERISVAGDDIRLWPGRFHAEGEATTEAPEWARRHAQAFGRGTTAWLRALSVAVVGCSGTGSPLIEQLVRLGVGRLVLVDPDPLEEKNLNRIVNARLRDVGKPKVEVLARAVRGVGLGTKVVALASDLATPDAVRAVAGCDLAFGCMDGAFGRNLLNRLCSFYLLPYFDLGVRLVADQAGAIEYVCGSVNTVQPDASTLLGRGVFTASDLAAEDLKRANPALYDQQLEEKYIRGVREDRPAVVSINTLIASLAVNELLARIHPFRLDSNERFAQFGISLEQGLTFQESESSFEQPTPAQIRNVGRGDIVPLLDRPDLDEVEAERC